MAQGSQVRNRKARIEITGEHTGILDKLSIEKAAHLAEGRKKFFQRSMGFDNGTSYDSPVTLGGSSNGGLSPQMGLKF